MHAQQAPTLRSALRAAPRPALRARRPVLLIAGPSAQADDLRGWIETDGGPATAQLDPAPGMAPWLERHAAGHSAIVVDLDDVGDADDAVTLGLALRRVAPGTPVVFLSSEVRMDDFGTERRAICDATLKKPLGGRRLIEALAQVMADHRARQVA